MRRVPEPFRIKMVEKITLGTRRQREKALEEAGFNPFALRAEEVFIDLLTDSGTNAMSDEQWSRMMVGDESYAGSRSFYRLVESVQHFSGYKYVVPAHQGRGAEKLLFENIIKKKNDLVISNMHFDTTKAHVELAGGRAINSVVEVAYDTQTYGDFKGTFDTELLETIII